MRAYAWVDARVAATARVRAQWRPVRAGMRLPIRQSAHDATDVMRMHMRMHMRMRMHTHMRMHMQDTRTATRIRWPAHKVRHGKEWLPEVHMHNTVAHAAHAHVHVHVPRAEDVTSCTSPSSRVPTCTSIAVCTPGGSLSTASSRPSSSRVSSARANAAVPSRRVSNGAGGRWRARRVCGSIVT